MRLAGVDGCRGGWIAAVEQGASISFVATPRFAELLAFDAVAVDVPFPRSAKSTRR